MAATPFTFDHVHSSIGFSVRHLVVSKVRGTFDRWSGELSIDQADLTNSSVAVSIEAASIDTRVQQRDDHLRSADFFDVAAHPTLTFRSKRFEKHGEDYRIVGDLTIRGVTREVALETEVNGFLLTPFGDERGGFSARASIDRRDFGLTWNKAIEAGGVVVGERIEIQLEVEAVKQAAVQAAA